MSETALTWLDYKQLTSSSAASLIVHTNQVASAAVKVARNLAVVAGTMLPVPTAAAETAWREAPCQFREVRSHMLTRLYADYATDVNVKLAEDIVLAAKIIWNPVSDEFRCAPVFEDLLGLAFHQFLKLEAEDPNLAAIRGACQETLSLAQRFQAGTIQTPSAEMLALAKEALHDQLASNEDDVQTWADRLGQDVGDATD